MGELLTAKELAKRLQLSVITIRHWGQKGKIPVVKPTPKVVRYNWEEVQKALGGNRSQRDACTAKVDRIGIPLIDWVYANMDPSDDLVGEQEAAGDLGLLRYYRDHPREFYGKVYLPILLKRYTAQMDRPVEEPEAEPLTREQIEALLRDAGSGSGREPEPARPVSCQGQNRRAGSTIL